MRFFSLNHGFRARLGAGLAIWTLAGSVAHAQYPCRAPGCAPATPGTWILPQTTMPPCAPPPYTPYPTVPAPLTPSPAPSTPAPTLPATPATPAPAAPVEPAPAPAPAAEPSPGPLATAAFAPNMMGNLLGAGRSVMFPVARTQGNGFVFANGTTNIMNAKVADDNSPIPQDRVGFRYNYFNQALSVTGISGQPRPDPDFGGTVEIPFTKKFDVHMYTFDLEKTFFDNLVSVQLRVPFATTVSSNLNLNYGTINAANPIIGAVDLAGNPIAGQQALNVSRTPDQTLGSDGTEFGNVQLIFKGLLYNTPGFAFSGGLSVAIPTAPATNVTVTDYLGDLRFNNADVQRVREFHIDNDTWSLSPFLAFLASPADRWFAQGFAQVELPLNSSRVTYRETLPAARPGLDPTAIVPPPGGLLPPINQQTSIREQTLLHLDLGTGFWVIRNPEARWLTGLAPTIELHYTKTLNDADIVTLPRDFSNFPAKLANGNFNPNLGQVALAPAPQVGNQRNQMDIVDLTIGTTLELANRSTLALGVAVPLNWVDRTYQWEFQVQYNYYFGGGRVRAPME